MLSLPCTGWSNQGRLCCRVRAGVRDPEKARGFLQTAKEYGIISPDAAKRLTLVPVDLTDVDTIASAIGNAGKVRDMHSTCFVSQSDAPQLEA